MNRTVLTAVLTPGVESSLQAPAGTIKRVRVFTEGTDVILYSLTQGEVTNDEGYPVTQGSPGDTGPIELSSQKIYLSANRIPGTRATVEIWSD